MNKPIARKDNIVVQKIDDETLVYDLDKNKAFCLNETSALVWEMCDGTRNPSQISDEMSKKLKTLISEEFVNLALDQLSKDSLLDNRGQDYFDGISRRGVIRKVGFASVVALPVVSSLVAPEASAAQSSCLSGRFSGCGSPCCLGLTCLTPGNHCCVPSANGANNPNYTACAPIGTCTAGMVPNDSCCSGTWSLNTNNPSPCPGEEDCRCDPMPA